MASNQSNVVGGIAVGVLAVGGLIGKFALRHTDDVVRGGARFGDDVAAQTARFGDDVAGQSARFGDELATAPRFGDDLPAAAQFGSDLTPTAGRQLQAVRLGTRFETLSGRIPAHLIAHLLRRYRTSEEERSKLEADLAAAKLAQSQPNQTPRDVAIAGAQVALVENQLAAVESEQQAIDRELTALEATK